MAEEERSRMGPTGGPTGGRSSRLPRALRCLALGSMKKMVEVGLFIFEAGKVNLGISQANLMIWKM